MSRDNTDCDKVYIMEACGIQATLEWIPSEEPGIKYRLTIKPTKVSCKLLGVCEDTYFEHVVRHLGDHDNTEVRHENKNEASWIFFVSSKSRPNKSQKLRFLAEMIARTTLSEEPKT